MSGQRCVACRRRLDPGPDRASRGADGAELRCAACGGSTVVADAGWVGRLAASIDDRDQEREAPEEPGLERRISAELPLDPLTSATLIVAQEDKRISE